MQTARARTLKNTFRRPIISDIVVRKQSTGQKQLGIDENYRMKIRISTEMHAPNESFDTIFACDCWFARAIAFAQVA